MDPMDIDHTFDVPDTPIRLATRGVDGRRSGAIHPLSLPSHSGEQKLLEGTEGRPVVIDSGSRGRPICPQKSSTSFREGHLFRRGIPENVNYRSQNSIHARKLQSTRLPHISNSSSFSLDDSLVDVKEEGSLHRPVTGKASSSGMQKDIQVEFSKRSGLTNGTFSHGMGKFPNASCNSSKETDNMNGIDSSIEHREVVGFVGNVQNGPANGNFVSVDPISPPKVNRQKRLVRNGCISPNNIAKAKQLAKKNVNDPEDEAHNNYGTVASSSPSNPIDLRNLIAEDNDSYTRKGKGIMTYPNSFKGHDVKNKSLHGGDCMNSSEKAVENSDSNIHADKSVEELGGWRRTRNRTRGIDISSSAGEEQHLVGETDGPRYPHQHQNNRLGRKEKGKNSLVENGRPEIQDLTSPEHVCPQPLTGSMPNPRVQLEQSNRSRSRVDSLIKRQRQGSTSSSCGESSALAPNDPEIVCLDSPVEAAHQKSTTSRENLHRIVKVDELSPPLRHNAQDEDARARQVEADERLARELQEQLYNEFPVFGIGEIDDHISLALEQQDDSNHSVFQRGSSRTNLPRQSQSGSSSNVLRRGSLSRGAASGRMARLRSRLAGQPRPVLPSRRTSLFPADMDVDMRMHILGTLEEFSNIRASSGFLQFEHEFNENDYEMLLALDDNNDRHLGASARHINNLPQSTVQTENFEETCTICLETPTIGDTIRHLPCLHKFHKDCIDEWLRRRTSCPVCKLSIT